MAAPAVGCSDSKVSGTHTQGKGARNGGGIGSNRMEVDTSERVKGIREEQALAPAAKVFKEEEIERRRAIGHTFMDKRKGISRIMSSAKIKHPHVGNRYLRSYVLRKKI